MLKKISLFLTLFSNLSAGISFSFKDTEIKDIQEAKIKDTLSHAVDTLKHSSDGYSLLNNHLVSVRQLGASQRMGDPTYIKYEPFANYRIYGFSGFTASSYSRQVVKDIATAHFLLPDRYSPDFYGEDINAHGKTEFSGASAKLGFFFNPIQGNYSQNIYAILEFGFYGSQSFNTYCITIKQAFGEITWSSGAFVFGQYYHPLFLKESFPRVVASNLGAPYETVSLTPQVRVTQSFKNLEFSFSLLGQSTDPSWGPAEIYAFQDEEFALFDNDSYIRNSMIPGINLNLKYILDKSYYGFSLNYLNLCPTIDNVYEILTTNFVNPIKTNVRVSGFIGEIYAHNSFSFGEINAKLIFAQNGSNQQLISGFGVEKVNPITNKIESYSPTNSISFWIDSFYLFYKEQMQLGLFLGATKNLGSFKELYILNSTNQPLVFTVEYAYSSGFNPFDIKQAYIYLISYAYRSSIRFVYNKNPFRFAIELEFDNASYGTLLNKYGYPLNVKPVYAFLYEIGLSYVY